MLHFFSRTLSVLITLFWIFLTLSIIMAILMAIPYTAVYVRIFQLAGGAYLGFLSPLGIIAFIFSFVMTNLWWVLLLAVPFIMMLRSRPFMGLAISVGAYAAVLLIPPQIIKFQSEQMLAQARGKAIKVRTIGPVSSVKIYADGCNALCEQMLLGGVVATVRVSAPSDDTLPRLMFQRSRAEECRALDATFPADAPCLLARIDDGAPNDLLIKHDRKGSVSTKRGDVGFTPYLVMREKITLNQRGADTPIARQTRLTWAEPQGYVPLRANTGFDGNGISGGGLVPVQRKNEDPDLDPATLLRKVGVPVAARRGKVMVKKYSYSTSFFGDYPEPAAYDVALIWSMLNMDGLKSRAGGYYLTRWAVKFSRYNIVADERELELLDQIYANLRPIPNEISLLKRNFPEYFTDGVNAFYISIRSDDRELRFDAINGISRAAKLHAPEQNAQQAEAYLALMRDGIAPSRIVELAGRFTFDPVPVLRHYLKEAEQDSFWPPMYVLNAACWADPRWGEQLAPFVLETARALPPASKVIDRNKAYGRALNALNVLGQRTAWENLQAELDPETVTALRPAAFGLGRCRN